MRTHLVLFIIVGAAGAALGASDVDAFRPTLDEANKLVIADRPIPDATVARMRAIADAHRGDRFGPYWDSLARRFAFYAGWHAAGDRAAALAAALDAQAEKSGALAGSDGKLRVSLPAAADRCYLLAGHWRRNVPGTISEDHSFAIEPAAPLQTFALEQWIPYRHRQEIFVGACTTGAGRLRGQIVFDQASAVDTLDWVVLSWPRDRFPPALATALALDFDPCDVDVWRSLWTRPIPGTIAYRGDEPVLVVSSDRAEYTNVNVASLAGKMGFARKSELHARPSGPVSVRSEYQAPECRQSAAMNPRGSAYIKCRYDIRNKYQSRIDAAGSRSTNARSAVAHDQAEREATHLVVQRNEEYHRCDRLYAPLRAAHQRLYGELRDQLERSPPGAPAAAGIARILAEHRLFQ